MKNNTHKLNMEDLGEIAGGVCVTKSGTRYYKADDKYIYFEHDGKQDKVGIRDLQCMLGRSCKEMQNFIDKINDEREYGSSK